MLLRLAITAVLLALPALPQRMLVQKAPMRDGILLSTNVFLPEKPGRYPTLLLRTPYNKGTKLVDSYKVFVARGYAVVVQDVRGRFESQGVFAPLTQEKPDGEDSIAWIARQPWSNGKVGMLGASYLGIVQWRAAVSKPPHLVAIFPIVAGSDEYRDRFYSRGGAMKLGHRLSWISGNLKLPWPFTTEFARYVRHLPLRTADRAAAGREIDFWQQALDHPEYDEFWRARSTHEVIANVSVPAFIQGGWYDNFVEGDLDAFAALSRTNPNVHILVGPWPHSSQPKYPSGIGFGPGAAVNIRQHQLAWFDHWMKNASAPFPAPPVRIFVMGINQWRDEQEWPLKRARATPFYLSSRRGANSLAGDGQLIQRPGKAGQDRFVYDPHHPVPTNGGAVCCDPRKMLWGPVDQRGVEARKDVLVYTSEPLKEDLEVTGPVQAVLHVATSAPDTDFTVKLVDVFPDGHARNLCDGILRLRYRNGLQAAVTARPGDIYRITVEAGVTSNVFLAGHRVRVEIASSNFPRFDRNPNTGRAIGGEATMKAANQTVFHGGARASHLLLPVVP